MSRVPEGSNHSWENVQPCRAKVGIVSGKFDFIQVPVHEDLFPSLQIRVLRVGCFSWIAKLFSRAAHQWGLFLISTVPVFQRNIELEALACEAFACVAEEF